jgi:hypothetical protein
MMVFLLLVSLVCTLEAVDGSVSPCEAFRHPEEYLGKELVVDGVLLQGEHGVFLDASRNCPGAVLRLDSASADRVPWSEYKKAGGRKGVGVLATVKGKIVNSKASQQPVFKVSSVSNIRSLRD